jgi:hypothetical protein
MHLTLRDAPMLFKAYFACETSMPLAQGVIEECADAFSLKDHPEFPIGVAVASGIDVDSIPPEHVLVR